VKDGGSNAVFLCQEGNEEGGKQKKVGVTGGAAPAHGRTHEGCTMRDIWELLEDVGRRKKIEGETCGKKTLRPSDERTVRGGGGAGSHYLADPEHGGADKKKKNKRG